MCVSCATFGFAKLFLTMKLLVVLLGVCNFAIGKFGRDWAGNLVDMKSENFGG